MNAQIGIDIGTVLVARVGVCTRVHVVTSRALAARRVVSVIVTASSRVMSPRSTPTGYAASARPVAAILAGQPSRVLSAISRIERVVDIGLHYSTQTQRGYHPRCQVDRSAISSSVRNRVSLAASCLEAYAIPHKGLGSPSSARWRRPRPRGVLANGDRVIYRRVDPGEQVRLERGRVIALRLGDAGAVKRSTKDGARRSFGDGDMVWGGQVETFGTIEPRRSG